MGRISRYITLACIFLRGGYSRAAYLKKKNYFKSIGDHCYLQPWNFGTEPEMISFGDNVHVATKVTFINHDISVFMLQYMEPNQKFKARKGEIAVGDNVFIGANTTILSGVHIGSNVIIGAGSVVTKDIPDNVVAAGIPCKPIGKFEDFKERITVKNDEEKRHEKSNARFRHPAGSD